MTRPDQSPDPLDGQVCCSVIPSADPQLLETYDLVEKGDVLDSIDDDKKVMMMTSNGQINHLIIAMIRTPRLYKSYWP